MSDFNSNLIELVKLTNSKLDSLTIKHDKSASRLISMEKTNNIQSEHIAALHQVIDDLLLRMDIIANTTARGGSVMTQRNPAKGSMNTENKVPASISTLWNSEWERDHVSLMKEYNIPESELAKIKREKSDDINRRRSEVEKHKFIGRALYGSLTNLQKSSLREKVQELKSQAIKMNKLDNELERDNRSDDADAPSDTDVPSDADVPSDVGAKGKDPDSDDDDSDDAPATPPKRTYTRTTVKKIMPPRTPINKPPTKAVSRAPKKPMPPRTK